MSALVNFSSISPGARGGAAGLLDFQTLAARPNFRLSAGFSFAAVFVYLAGCLTLHLWMAGLAAQTTAFARRLIKLLINRDMIVLFGFRATTDFGGVWGPMFAPLLKTGQSSWLVPCVGLPLVSWTFLWFAIELAAWRLRRVWQEEPPSAGRLWLEQKLVTPIVGVAFLHRWMRRKLERNPIGWLEQRTWSGRRGHVGLVRGHGVALQRRPRRPVTPTGSSTTCKISWAGCCSWAWPPARRQLSARTRNRRHGTAPGVPHDGGPNHRRTRARPFWPVPARRHPLCRGLVLFQESRGIYPGLGRPGGDAILLRRLPGHAGHRTCTIRSAGNTSSPPSCPRFSWACSCP